MSDERWVRPITHYPSRITREGCLFFNNLEEVNHTREVDLGVAGFRLYVSPIAVVEFDGDGSNTSAESEAFSLIHCGRWGVGELVRVRALRLTPHGYPPHRARSAQGYRIKH